MTAMLAEAGFDLVHPFDPRELAREPGLEMLVDPVRAAGWLVGNTRAFWPRFLAARRADPALAASTDPIQDHVERTVAKIPDARCYFAHRAYDGAYLPFQRAAAAAGLGTLAPTRLVIHPVYGPWFALRAIVLVPGVPERRALEPSACNCGVTCSAAFDRARDSNGPDAWRAWLAVRDACCVGRAYRYDDDQIEYHYTKDPSVLTRA